MNVQGPGHETFADLAGAYVIGAVDRAERERFEAHLRECGECQALVRSLRPAADALAHVPLVDPPASLRDRVMAAAAGDRSTRLVVPLDARRADVSAASWSGMGWLAAAAVVVIAVGTGAYALSLRRQIAELELRLTDAVVRLVQSEEALTRATRALGSAQVRMTVLTAPDLLRIDLAGQARAPGAAGRAFLSRSQGLVFAATGLPAPPAGQVYQLWYVPPGGAPPISAGLVEPDDTGSVSLAFDVPAGAPAPAAMALTNEPAGGLPAPSGEFYLLGQSQ